LIGIYYRLVRLYGCPAPIKVRIFGESTAVCRDLSRLRLVKVRRFGSSPGSGSRWRRRFLYRWPQNVSVNVTFLPKVSQFGSPTQHFARSSKVSVFGISQTPIFCGVHDIGWAERPLNQLSYINQASRARTRSVADRTVRTFGSRRIEQLPPAITNSNL
jgi:hypothetical protein